MLISETAEKGDRLETLMALRQKVAETLDETHSGRDIASLALQLQRILIQIEEIQDGNKTDEIDAIIQQRGPTAPQNVRDKRGRPLHLRQEPQADECTQ